MNFSSLGHFMVHGATTSGKSFYARHLVRVLPNKKIFVFTTTPEEWSEVIVNPDGTSQLAYTVFTEDFEENVAKILEECKAYVDTERNAAISTGKIYKPHGMFSVVLDDFNSAINVRTDETYKSLFTKSRHAGIRVINLIHQARSIGPTARTNSKTLIFMNSASDHEIQELAGLFFSNNHVALKSLAREAAKKNPYTVVVVDIPSRTTGFDLALPAPDNYKRVVFNPDGSYELPNPNAVQPTQIDALVPIGGPNTTASAGQMPSYTGLQPAVAQQISVGAKSANQLYDNSKNNFQINSKIRAEQMVEVNQAQVDIKIANIQNNYKIELRQGIMDVYDILQKPFRTPAETQKIVHVMQKSLRCSPPLTVYDYESAIPVFMETYFPEHQFRHEGREQTEIADKLGALIASRGDYTFTALESVKLAKMFFK